MITSMIFLSASCCIPHTGLADGLSAMTLRSPLPAVFWKHSVLSGKTQRRALPRQQSEEMKILIYYY